MMNIQPGVGHTFYSSSKGFSIDVTEQFPSSEIDDVCYPFRIKMAGKSGSDYLFSCCPGTVNSIIPQIGTSADADKRLDKSPTPTAVLNFDTDGYSYIHLKVSYDTDEDGRIIFPVPTPTDVLSPRVISNSEQQFATVDSVFYLIATIYKDSEGGITINQFADSSLWCDRIQVGSLEAVPNYFFAKS